MLSLTNLIKRNNAWEEIDTFSIKGQRQWIQIATSKEAECSAFLKKLELEIQNNPDKDNIYGIQLNVSSPSPNRVTIGQGAALIKRPTKICNLVKALLLQNKYKIGVKLRLGLNSKEVKQRKIFAVLKELEPIARDNSNFTNVTIHLKHAMDSSSSEYDYSLLPEIASYNLPIVINGGIKNAADITKLIEMISPENRKNIMGVMVGRAALKNPNCFIEINRDLNNSKVTLRNNKELKSEFDLLCKQHKPKEIYLKNIEGKIVK